MHRGSQTRAVQHRVQTCIAQPAEFRGLNSGDSLLNSQELREQFT
jgi:hypothetical protein